MNSTTKIQADAKAGEAHTLNAATQDLIASVERKNNKAVRWFIISWTILFALGVFGIYKQNQIASANKKHIDCIVKLFTTPLPSTAHSRQIINPSTTCSIKFTT